MLENKIIKDYVDYTAYSVIKLKDKYGFRVVLTFSDGSKETMQIGGFTKKSDANKERDKTVADLVNHSFVVYPKIKFENYINYWLEIIMRPKITYNSYMSYRNVIKSYAIDFFREYYLTQINTGHIQKFYNQVS